VSLSLATTSNNSPYRAHMLCGLHLYTLHYYKSDTEPMQTEIM
jgi:hypothetical protein